MFPNYSGDFISISESTGAPVYNTLIDIDRNMDRTTQAAILNVSDLIVATVPQRIKDINNLNSEIEKGEVLNKKRTIIAMGKYDERSKYNTKNVSRNILR